MDGEFGDPWQKVTVDVGSLVPEGSDIRVAFREYHNNNWYDVRAIELDVISGGERPRSCLKFDGTNDYVNIPHSSIGNPSGSFTVECWAQVNSGGSLISKHKNDGGSARSGYVIEYDSAGGHIQAVLGHTNGWTRAEGANPWSTGVWHHVAMVYDADADTLALYEDGIQTSLSTNVSDVVFNDNDLWFGASQHYGGYLNGTLDEIRLWDTARTTEEIRDSMNVYLRGVESNLVAYYRLDSTFGGDVFDFSRNGHDGWFCADADSYSWTHAQATYNGVDDSTFIPVASRAANYTIEAWVYPEDTSARNIMTFTDGNPLTAYLQQLRITSGGQFQFYSYDGSERVATDSTVLIPKQWYHVVGTAVNGGDMKLYVNGQLRTTTAAGNTLWGSGYTGYSVGADSALGNYTWFKGRIGDVSETNRVKDVAEILADYQAHASSDSDTWPAWTTGNTPLGDAVAAQQWHPRGVWSQRGIVDAGRGLALNASGIEDKSYGVLGDNNRSGTTPDNLSFNAVRLSRIWHFDQQIATQTVASVSFKPAQAGMTGALQDQPGKYSLLRRDGTSGTFSAVAQANAVSDGEITFNNTTLDEGYYTLGLNAADAPETLWATNITAYGFTATWSIANGASSYRLDVATDSGFSSLVSEYDNRTVNDVSCDVTGLSPSKTYYWRVRSEYLGLISTNSDVATTATLSEGMIGVLPSTLEFEVPYSQTDTALITLTNSGQTAYNFVSSNDAGWISLSPASATVNPESFIIQTAQVNCVGLDLGTYYASNVFNSATAVNSPVKQTVVLTVVPAQASVGLSGLSYVYNGTERSATVSTDPTNLSCSATYNGSADLPVNAGNYTVVASITDSRYVGSATGTLAIAKADQSILSVSPTNNSVFASTDVVDLSASASSGLPVSFSVVSGPGVLFGGDELRFTGAGEVQVQAVQGGDDNWNPTSVSTTFHVTDNTLVHYVTQAGQTPYPPYASWATAASNIQQAVDLAVAGDTVVVSNGIYQIGTTNAPIGGGTPCRLVADKEITIQSVNGQETTEIRGGTETRGVYLGSGAVLSGFTVSGGSTVTNGDPWIDQSGGGVFINTTGTVENCRIEKNTAAYNGGGVYLYEGGSADRLMVISNAAFYGGGISSVRGGTFRNSLLLNNEADIEGGGGMIWWSNAVINCTVVSNLASGGAGDGLFFYQGGALRNSIVFQNDDSEVYFKEIAEDSEANWIGKDPLFVQEFHLSAASPCVDGGLDAFGAGKDLAGRARTIGAHPDVGAYETPQSRMILVPETNLVFYAVYGESNPTDQSVIVSNSGAYELYFTSTNAADWLTVSPFSALLAPGGSTSLLYSVQIDVLNAGVYETSNRLDSATASNAPQSFIVQLNVDKADQTLSGFTPTNGSVFFTTNTAGLFATASSGLPVSFTNTGADIVSWQSATSVQFNAHGTASLVAEQGGNINYNPAPALTNSLIIHGVPQVGPVSFERTASGIFKVRCALLLNNTTDPEGSELSLYSVKTLSDAGYPVQVAGDWIFYSPPDDFIGSDSFTFTVHNEFGGENSGVATVTFVVTGDNDALTLNVVSTTSSSGNMTIRFAGIPGRIYTVQATENLSPPEWVDIGQVQIGSHGYTTLIDSNAPPSRYYRTIQTPETP
jgi:hypothetical protein